jgi:hypothetical protein
MLNGHFDSQAKSFSREEVKYEEMHFKKTIELSIWLREPFAESRHATTIPLLEDKRLIISGKQGGSRKTGLSDLLTAIS